MSYNIIYVSPEALEEIRNWGMEEPKPLPPKPINIDYKECWHDLKQVLLNYHEGELLCRDYGLKRELTLTDILDCLTQEMSRLENEHGEIPMGNTSSEKI
jgi:hypothetical protein